MSERLSPMQRAAHIPQGFIQCPEGITIQHWTKALDEALRILRNDDALSRMDATAREVMATIQASHQDAWESPSKAASWAYDAAEALERERERRVQLPENTEGKT